MPAIFTHHQFGEQVVTQLDDNLKDIIEAYDKEFMIGLQGPDIFFFYRPWKENAITAYGHHLHKNTARAMFEQGMEHERNSAAYVYMLGVVCHFALDSICHPFVNEYAQSNGISHTEVESEFEKMLLRRNGKNPFTFRMDLLIPTGTTVAESIYQFYRVFDTQKIQYALRWMQNFRRLFTEPSAIRQHIISLVLKIAGFGKYQSQILQLKDNPKCAKSNAMLYQLYLDAIGYAVSLLQELDYSKQNNITLSEKWDKSFV